VHVALPRDAWPALELADWQDTYATLHLWTQIVGKVRTKYSPRLNHWWHSALYVTPRGLTTSAIPYQRRIFDMTFDFIEQRLRIEVSDGQRSEVGLVPQTVADFYRAVFAALRSVGIDVSISRLPQEIPAPIPFDEDQEHGTYDAVAARRFWQVLVQVDRVFQRFRAGFIGKSSPVHFFWGAPDLAVTRFSGRRAPERPGADVVQREGYSHEVISAGFWAGGGGHDASFYAYAAPEPAGFREAAVDPAAAAYSTALGEFILGYDVVRSADDPDETLLAFLQATYAAAADLAGWDRAALER
jgi:Family of unknown function (DUF5996)